MNVVAGTAQAQNVSVKPMGPLAHQHQQQHHHGSSMSRDFVPITVGCSNGPGDGGDEVSEMTFSRRPSIDSLDTYSALSCSTPRVAAEDDHPLAFLGGAGGEDKALRGGGGGLGGRDSFGDIEDPSDDPYDLGGGGASSSDEIDVGLDDTEHTRSAGNGRRRRSGRRGGGQQRQQLGQRGSETATQMRSAAAAMRISEISSGRRGGGSPQMDMSMPEPQPQPPLPPTPPLKRGTSAQQYQRQQRRSSLSHQAFKVHARRKNRSLDLSYDPVAAASPLHPSSSNSYGWSGGNVNASSSVAARAAPSGDDAARQVAELKVLLAEARTEAESHRNLAKKLLEENVALKGRMNSQSSLEYDQHRHQQQAAAADNEHNNDPLGAGLRRAVRGAGGTTGGSSSSAARDRDAIERLREEVKDLKRAEFDALEKMNQCFRDQERLRSENNRLKREKESILGRDSAVSAEYLEKIQQCRRERDAVREERDRLAEEREEAVLERNALRSRMGTMTVQVSTKAARVEEELAGGGRGGQLGARGGHGGGNNAAAGHSARRNPSLLLGDIVSRFQSSRNVTGEMKGGGGATGGGGGAGAAGLNRGGALSRQKSKTEVSPEDLLWDSYGSDEQADSGDTTAGAGHQSSSPLVGHADEVDGRPSMQGRSEGSQADMALAAEERHRWRMGSILEDGL